MHKDAIHFLSSEIALAQTFTLSYPSNHSFSTRSTRLSQCSIRTELLNNNQQLHKNFKRESSKYLIDSDAEEEYEVEQCLKTFLI